MMCAVGVVLAGPVSDRFGRRPVLVAGCGLFAATFGVAVYSDMDIISSMCMLMARGAIISVLMVAFILPAMLILCDKAIIATTLDMRKNVKPAAESAAL